MPHVWSAEETDDPGFADRAQLLQGRESGAAIGSVEKLSIPARGIAILLNERLSEAIARQQIHNTDIATFHDAPFGVYPYLPALSAKFGRYPNWTPNCLPTVILTVPQPTSSTLAPGTNASRSTVRLRSQK